MRIWQILRTLEALEDTMAQAYECLRLGNAGDADARAFFARMRDDEFAHRAIVRYERRVMFRTPDNHDVVAGYDGDELVAVQSMAEDLVSRSAFLGLDEAVRLAAHLERSATEGHYRTVAAEANAELGRLVRKLGGGDRDHATRLDAFARRRGFALAA